MGRSFVSRRREEPPQPHGNSLELAFLQAARIMYKAIEDHVAARISYVPRQEPLTPENVLQSLLSFQQRQQPLSAPEEYSRRTGLPKRPYKRKAPMPDRDELGHFIPGTGMGKKVAKSAQPSRKQVKSTTRAKAQPYTVSKKGKKR